MHRAILKELFVKGFENKPVVYDTYAMTWGVSHVRFVLGKKSDFSSQEDFFKEAMLATPERSGWFTADQWIKETDFNEWIDGLVLDSPSPHELKTWVTATPDEVRKYADSWPAKDTIDFDKVKLPTEFRNVIKIKETDHARFYINTYTGFVSEDEEHYFFLEDQFES